jgi:maltooligosyltrehalose trehalohydrolase
MLFEVWAPKATEVELCLGEARHEMESSDGWFRAEAEAAAGDQYAFSLDGDDPLPDPRSRFQPDGVDGWSAVVEHDAFSWGDRGWRSRPLGEWVIYEAHVGTFTEGGTFPAARDRLQHLVDLGVNAIELMPVAEFSGDHGWGYDGVDLYAPHHAYGAPDELKALVDACHSKGLAVVMDVVYNHLGPAGNYLSRFGHYFTDAYGTPWGDAVNFDDMDSGPVRDFFIENALMWLRDYHCDALRLDAIHAMLDQSATHFLEEMGRRVGELGAQLDRPLYLIAESDLNAPRVVQSVERGGYGMDAQWSDDLHHSLHALFTGERSGYYSDFGTVEQVAKGVKQAYVFDGNYSEHRRRVHGRPPENLDGTSFLAYLQTHDQVGNRAVGERIGHLVSPELVKIGAALVLTSPFIPMLFQGEEWNASSPFLYFTDHKDPDLGRAVREGRRREFESFGWNPEDVPDPQARETFVASKLKWAELNEDRHREILDWYRELIRLRGEVPALGDPDLKKVITRSSETPPWLIVERGDVTVACNLGDEEVELSVVEKRRWKILLTSAEPTEMGDSVRLPPTSVTIWGGPAIVPGRLLL